MNTADLIRNRYERLHAEFGSVVTPEPSKIRIEVPLKEASRFGIMNTDDNNRIIRSYIF